MGVDPGAVTPFALINDFEHVVTVVLDNRLFLHEFLGFHPLCNNATTVIKSSDLKKFIESCGNAQILFDFVR